MGNNNLCKFQKSYNTVFDTKMGVLILNNMYILNDNNDISES